jgi:DNA repair exonuclease SbcCD ATPase subunit
MASGGKEHRMVFDIRGRRKHVVKVVYAVLAVLMGASLFLVVGPVNLGQLFSNTSGSGEAAKPFEEQAERLEVKLRKEPESEELLQSLTRAQVSAGNSRLSIEPSEDDLVKALQQYQQASNTWSEYLKATKEPSAGTAQLIAPALVALAERSRTFQEAASNIEAAADAQQIVAAQRPTLNSFSTLALYTYFTGDFAAAEKAEAKAKGLTKGKVEVEELEKQLGEVQKNAKKFQGELKKAEAAQKAAAKGNKGNPESLENPSSPLSGAFGGGGLGE